MPEAPSSTWFTTAPQWEWLIVGYFFLGGLAGGCYLLAAIIDLFGRVEDRPLARLGYYVAFPCVLVSGALLTLDLGRPERFWHMLIQSNTLRPMFKYWSPMSVGAWALLVFGLFTFLSFLGALADEPRIRWPALRSLGTRWPVLHRLRPPAPLGRLVTAIGALFGLYIAGYTGVLLAVTNRPIWSDTALLGMLFIVSATSTSAALIILLADRYGWKTRGVADLRRMDDWIVLLELLVLAAVMISLGPVLRAWLNVWGVLLLVGVVIPGLIVPLLLSWRARRRQLREAHVVTDAILVLIGGFFLRVVIVFSSEAI